jgi:hypothetical protein
MGPTETRGLALRPNVRRLSLVAALLLLALASAATAQGAAKTMRIRVMNATAQRLVIRDKTMEKGRWRSPGPVDIPSLGVGDQTMESESNQARGHTRWQIGDSAYKLRVYGDAENGYSDCSIQTLANSNTNDSPYSCSTKSDYRGDGDWNQYTVVQPKNASSTHLLAGQRRREVFETLCGNEEAGKLGSIAACKVSVLNLSNGVGPVTASGAILAQCGPGKVEMEDSWTNTVSDTTTIGGSIGAVIKVPTVIEVKSELTTEWNWTSIQTWADGTTLSLERDKAGQNLYGWVDTRPSVRIATADVTAEAGNQKFILPGVDVKAPLAKGMSGQNFLQSAPLPSGFCEGNSTTALVKDIPPDPIVPEKVYVMGIHGANRRVMEVPGQSHAGSVQLQIGAFENRSGQRWQLSKVTGHDGYYQIRSDNDLDLCLDQYVAQAIAMQHGCKAANDSTIANQLWKVSYGSKANRHYFQLESKVNGKLIGIQDSATGTKLVMAGPDAPDVRTWWEFDNV